MDMYQNTAEDLLRELAHLKSKERALLADIKAIQTLLTHHVENGDLDHIKTDAPNTYHFEDTNYIFNAGRVTWNYDNCGDVVAARNKLKELEETQRSIPNTKAVQNLSAPFWTVRA